MLQFSLKRGVSSLLSRSRVDPRHDLIEIRNFFDCVYPKLVIQLFVGRQNEFVDELGHDEHVWDQSECRRPVQPSRASRRPFPLQREHRQIYQWNNDFELDAVVSVSHQKVQVYVCLPIHSYHLQCTVIIGLHTL